MITVEEQRINVGDHAILIREVTGGYGFRALVWMNAGKGNTSLNPDFREIMLESGFSTSDDALEAGKRVIAANNKELSK